MLSRFQRFPRARDRTPHDRNATVSYGNLPCSVRAQARAAETAGSVRMAAGTSIERPGLPSFWCPDHRVTPPRIPGARPALLKPSAGVRHWITARVCQRWTACSVLTGTSNPGCQDRLPAPEAERPLA